MNDLGESPRLGMAVVGFSRMYQLQVSLRQSAYGGVRAVLIVPRDMITTGPAPGIAHGIGATSRPTSSLDMSQLQHVVPPPGKRKPKPATGPVPSVAAPVPTGAAAAAPRPAVPAAAMEDDVPVVTEWTENGLPQRRSRGRAPLGSHNLPQQPPPPSTPTAPSPAGTRARATRAAARSLRASGWRRSPRPSTAYRRNASTAKTPMTRGTRET